MNDIRDVTSSLAAEQNTVKVDNLQLKTANKEATETIETLESDVSQLKTNLPSPPSTSGTLETMIVEGKTKKAARTSLYLKGQETRDRENTES